jgi:hydroxyacylglutathione hydrolase
MANVQVVPIPAFEDNYLWLLVRGEQALVVDPGDAAPVLDYLAQHGLKLCAILCTHHHGDHVGGIRTLLQHFDVPVYGPAHETIPSRTHPVAEGDLVKIPELGLEFSVIDVPGHTAGHVAYYGAERLFCGDTLFACGCGRLFEGTPAMMYASISKLARLPDATLMYCAHEYTLNNIRFAKKVEPDNADLIQRETNDRASRAKHLPTVPSTLGLEKRTNPFMRSLEPTVIQAAERYVGHALSDPAEVFGTVRAWKDDQD